MLIRQRLHPPHALRHSGQSAPSTSRAMVYKRKRMAPTAPTKHSVQAENRLTTALPCATSHLSRPTVRFDLLYSWLAVVKGYHSVRGQAE
ncbi:hypothetical protein QR680_002948 [Steinernema hermaphroditum]|uniref:Uncharacterized protein n=1 Tax=Steinernema hermaphroditum TaxID=289476 RepID=A0AA39H4W3_9BILA|nr:hypothetical protein QR680_002948 [Steinernema hermaphroditum]